MGQYLKALFNFIPNAESRTEFTDLEILIKELRSWPASHDRVWRYEFFNNPKTHLLAVLFFVYYDPQTLDSFLDKAEERLREVKKGR